MIGFLLGGIPSGLLVGRCRGIDLRSAGSRNIGATNAFRVLGARWGALVFFLDALKGVAASFIPRLLTANGLAGFPPDLLAPTLAGGIAAILGHMFTPWLAFRGGRGVATSLGVFLGIMPLPTLLAFGVWVLLLVISHRVSVGSIGAALAYPLFVAWLAPSGFPRAVVTTSATMIAVLILLRHSPNIRRLLSGTEPRTIGASKEGHQ